jgi:hypothetical protein
MPKAKNGMSSSTNRVEFSSRAKRLVVTDDYVTIQFRDGHSISVPTKWYPRILHGTTAERAKIEIWNDGVYWPDLDADISYRAILLGSKSGESNKSFRRWLGNRARGEQVPILELPMPPRLSRMLKRGRKNSSRKSRSRS